MILLLCMACEFVAAAADAVVFISKSRKVLVTDYDSNLNEVLASVVAFLLLLVVMNFVFRCEKLDMMTCGNGVWV